MLDRIFKQINELEKYASSENSTASNISNASIYWQIDHTLKVINGTYQLLIDSDPNQFKGKFNFLRFIYLTKGSFPRGKVRAPKSLVSQEEVLNQAQILSDLQNVRIKLEQCATLDPKSHFKHPIFKNLNLKQSFRFLEIHTEHHLKIIREIKKAVNLLS